MSRPLLLDMYCGGGGASMGYFRAGFDVIGVDLHKQKNYPFPFVQADALNPPFDLSKFDAIHASPPCQAHTTLRTMPNGRKHPNLIPQTRDLLRRSGKPFIIENVPGSPLNAGLLLCGTMFALRTECGAELRRHRFFETNWFYGMVPPCEHYAQRVVGVYGGHGRDRALDRRTIGVFGSHSRDSAMEKRKEFIGAAFKKEDANRAMGIDWMTGSELSQAIPPAYTEFIGKQLIETMVR